MKEIKGNLKFKVAREDGPTTRFTVEEYGNFIADIPDGDTQYHADIYNDLLDALCQMEIQSGYPIYIFQNANGIIISEMPD